MGNLQHQKTPGKPIFNIKEHAMKKNILYSALLIAICISLSNYTALAQNIDKEALTGTWVVEGTIMGDNGEGWVMPHKHSAPDCAKDHTVFSSDGNSKEVKYTSTCEPIEQIFQWELEGSKLILSKGDKSITWHLLSLEDNQLKVGVQMRPNSERRMYVAYRKQE